VVWSLTGREGIERAVRAPLDRSGRIATTLGVILYALSIQNSQGWCPADSPVTLTQADFHLNNYPNVIVTCSHSTNCPIFVFASSTELMSQ